MSRKKILLLAGDGIGVEVVDAAKQIINKLTTDFDLALDIESALIGGQAIDAEGEPLSQKTLEKAKEADGILLGAVGGDKWNNVERHLRPEAGLLKLRKELDLYANLRPVKCFDALASFSSLKEELIKGLDIIIVRELTSGVYFGKPRGIIDDGLACVDTQYYSRAEVERVLKTAFGIAGSRSGSLCSVDKANVMETGHFWRSIAQRMGDSFKDIKLSFMYADNCAMQLVRNPKQFDVIVTDNLFGDILSDEAAMLTGSLGMLPSASLGKHTASGGKTLFKSSLFEAVHGSAPDIAGKGIANPIGAIMSLAMLFEYALGREDLSKKIENAIDASLKNGLRTADIGGNASTQDMTDAILSEI